MEKPISLYLRKDCSMLLVEGDKTIEIPLSPRQLLDLGIDALRLALHRDPSLQHVLQAAIAGPFVSVSDMPEGAPLQ